MGTFLLFFSFTLCFAPGLATPQSPPFRSLPRKDTATSHFLEILSRYPVANSLASTTAYRAVSNLIGLTGDKCTTNSQCRGIRRCVCSGAGCTCAVDECICFQRQVCLSNAACTSGEVCIILSLGTICVSEDVVRYSNWTTVEPLRPGMTKDPCDLTSHCFSPRTCVGGECIPTGGFKSCEKRTDCPIWEYCARSPFDGKDICISARFYETTSEDWKFVRFGTVAPPTTPVTPSPASSSSAAPTFSKSPAPPAPIPTTPLPATPIPATPSASGLPTTTGPSPSPSFSSCTVSSVCFILDGTQTSGSFGAGFQKSFSAKVARALTKSSPNVNFSAHIFNSRVISTSTSGEMFSLKEFLPKLFTLKATNSFTQWYLGLRACYEDLIGRPGQRVVVFMTDGEDFGRPRASSIAPAAFRDARIGVTTVEIGSVPNLVDIASSAELHTRVPRFQIMGRQAPQVTRRICEAGIYLGDGVVAESECKTSEARCAMTVEGASGLPIVDFSSASITTVVEKFGGIVPQIASNNVHAVAFKRLGGVKTIGTGVFKVSKTGSGKVKLSLRNGMSVASCAGRCVRLAISVRRFRREFSKCLVIRLKA